LLSLAEQQLSAVAGILQSPAGGNQAPEAVTMLVFKSQVLPVASLRTLISMDFAVFCNTPNKSLPVRVYLYAGFALVDKFSAFTTTSSLNFRAGR
jgi:hypothetical protein